ncbi:MAG: hypothetical protein EA425_06295 [Puniceicoccaceae bacterium]|nr:MAG: hypothetical protein EA425_06295 [Puniceicoccaceae bacterium]
MGLTIKPFSSKVWHLAQRAKIQQPGSQGRVESGEIADYKSAILFANTFRMRRLYRGLSARLFHGQGTQLFGLGY